jgi:gliding motility-associated peptidyl-prolyl isomerase
MKKLILLFLFINLISCKKTQPRKPITVKSGNSREYSVDAKKTKRRLEIENKIIKSYIKVDSINSYLNSKKGFMFSYIKKDSTNDYKSKYGDALLYNYYVTDLEGNTIYNSNEIGVKSYYIDQESNIIEGLRQGLKIIKVGENIKFIFPSQLAYGYRGDGQRIKPNLPIICYVTLKELVIKESLNRSLNK